MTRTNEKISKSISKKSYATNLKNDIDRKDPRHGLACEYLFEVLREKQFYKEMKWLCINLRKEYKEVIIPLIKQKIKDIKTNYNHVKESIEKINTLQKEFESTNDSEEYYAKITLERDLKKLKEEITESKNYIINYKNDLKLILQCRSEIFELKKRVSLGLKTKNSIFLINFQKNIYNKIIIPSLCIEKPINSISMSGNRTNTVIAFADVFIPYMGLDKVKIELWNRKVSRYDKRNKHDFSIYLLAHIKKYLTNGVVNSVNLDNLTFEDCSYYCGLPWDKWSNSTLGEVKIAKQESEEVLQQINLYHELVFPTKTYICLDYQDTQLLSLTKDSKIQVNCLGSKFDEFCNNRPIQELEEI